MAHDYSNHGADQRVHRRTIDLDRRLSQRAYSDGHTTSVAGCPAEVTGSGGRSPATDIGFT